MTSPGISSGWRLPRWPIWPWPPPQDVLNLGAEARMNLPGRPSGNRGWRYQSGRLTDALRDRLKELATLYAR